jgi:formate dehydrogenase major subunit
MPFLPKGKPQEINPGERPIDAINRSGIRIPQDCYHPQLGPIQTCDTCMVEVNGKLEKACATEAADGLKIETGSSRAQASQREAFDRIPGNHLLYCTVGDNNNGNRTVHNTTRLLAVESQETPYENKPYDVDSTNPFYRYDPQQWLGRWFQIGPAVSHKTRRLL